MRTKQRDAFTLIEILAAVALISILIVVAVPISSRMIERAKCVKCIQNLRNVGVGFLAMAADRNGYFYTKEEIGNSSYREAKDPMSLPAIFKRHGYLESDAVWLSPGGRPDLKQYGVNYAWSRAGDLTSKPIVSVGSARTTAVVWNNHTMTLPSVNGVSEPSTGGPRAAPAAYRYWSWNNKKAINFLFLDGHVETK